MELFRGTIFKRDFSSSNPSIFRKKCFLLKGGTLSETKIIYLKIEDWKMIFLLERLPCIVPCYFQGVTVLFFSTSEVGEADLGIRIGGKVLTGRFLQVQDLRNAGV